jgi:hypothetical protein
MRGIILGFVTAGLVLTVGGSACADVTIINETFDSYADGAWPSGFYQFDYNYERFTGSHVVSGVSPACPSGTKCFMNSNPYSGWGNDINKPFVWDPASSQKLVWSASIMLPLNSATDDNASLELVTSPTDRRRICTFQLVETGSNDIKAVWSDGTTTHDLASGYHNNEWINVRGELDVANATYDLFVNGTLIGDNLTIQPGRTVSEVGDVYLGKGFWNANAAYYDDLYVAAVPAPEPSTIVLAVLGVVGGFCARRFGLKRKG